MIRSIVVSRDEHMPFDTAGDVHDCYDKLAELFLEQLRRSGRAVRARLGQWGSPAAATAAGRAPVRAHLGDGCSLPRRCFGSSSELGSLNGKH
ncbi:MAG TPA: hypothetical protein VFO07_11515 [Roseiflexaceae bacterium]|nr:hypothetical protein [Roseiflexaceae bacterium]